MKTSLWALALAVFLCASCVRGAFQPVNKGREYGDPVPLMVSHLGNSGPHYFLQDIICFDYLCRKKAGKRKAMSAISFDDFKKRLRKNAKKGVYKNLMPPRKAIKPDTIQGKQPEPVVVSAPLITSEPAAEEPILKADSLIVLGDLLFETNRSDLRGEHFTALDSLAKFLERNPTLQVVVTGHTDNTGAERHNVALSTRRAQVVAEYLIDRGAVFERVTYEGFGSSQPIADNGTESGRSKNRRVEILIRNPVKR